MFFDMGFPEGDFRAEMIDSIIEMSEHVASIELALLDPCRPGRQTSNSKAGSVELSRPPKLCSCFG